MKTVTGVSSVRYGYMVPGWESSPHEKLPKDFSNEELSEGMTSSVAKKTAIGLKKRSISLGNQVESATDIGEKINNLSKQLNAVAGIALVAVSMSDEGL